MTDETLIAGIGCQGETSPESIVALVRRALALYGNGATVQTVAAPGFKAGLAALGEAAAALESDLVFIENDALRNVQARCPTHSAASLRATGFGAIAEAAALAAAGAGGVLVLARISSEHATCALARRCA